MKLDFPLLTKDDIEIRIGQMSKDSTRASLLLYQDARCGMKYLDQVVGPMNWQKKFYEVRGLVICSLGINVNYNHPELQPLWVWKDDTGSAGTIEEEKSIISDSFKRCCVCFGLARELYTAPTIWVNIESKFDKFKVESITYNKNREIETIEISNEKGYVVFSYKAGKKVSLNGEKAPKTTNQTQSKQEDLPQEPKGSIDSEDLSYIERYISVLSSQDKFFNWLDEKYGTMNPAMLTYSQGVEIVSKLSGRGKK